MNIYVIIYLIGVIATLIALVHSTRKETDIDVIFFIIMLSVSLGSWLSFLLVILIHCNSDVILFKKKEKN